MPRIKPVCTECGSDNVSMDGILEWDITAQKWIARAELDNTDCEDCGGECNIKWEQIDV